MLLRLGAGNGRFDAGTGGLVGEEGLLRNGSHAHSSRASEGSGNTGFGGGHGNGPEGHACAEGRHCDGWKCRVDLEA